MKIAVEDGGACRKVMHVSVEWEQVATDYGALVKAYAASAAVPGFRKGKAPENVVETRYLKQITEDAKERLVPRVYRDAIAAEGYQPVAVVSVTDVSLARGEGMSMDVTFDVAPTFKLPKYSKITLKDETRQIGPAEIDEAINAVRGQYARFEDVEGRSVAEGDLVRIDYHGTIDGRPLAELASDCSGLGDGADFWAMVGTPEFIPGVALGVVGMKPGEEKEIRAHFPDDFHVPSVAGRDAVYRVTLKGLRERVLPEINADFLKRFNVESESALREKVAEDLREHAQAEEKGRRRDEISRFLLEKTKIEAPQSLVTDETRHVFYSMVRTMIRRGVPHEQLSQSRDQLTAEAARVGEDRVKLSFILSAIAREEDISVTDADVDDRIQSMARESSSPPEKVKAQIEERDRMDTLRQEILCDKTLEHLLETARVKG
jgi:trigger factor